jgi:prevent-host-death family protein
MDVTATEAKNRLGQMLDLCQREPVVIAKSGRRHSVLISAAQYDALVAASRAEVDPRALPPRTPDEFYARHKDWVDENNRRLAEHGLWNEDLRTW